MTKQAIEKLSDQARAFCETKQTIIRMSKAPGMGHREDRNKSELRGYLACLLHLGIITQSEFRCLYTFYGTM